ncbi:hypothetical protein [Bacillus toyonensis]|uniref:hypothetical protein n=1 Tax=Bacillus toyonensis TaxID=155322 RepID=UPI000BFE5775|nr:hypothetical protein [Bacillus toyonensis]PHA15500.1 hypothetical protein COE66_06985 [Bacillus toyonensis]
MDVFLFLLGWILGLVTGLVEKVDRKIKGNRNGVKPMNKRLKEVKENITNIADHAICMTKFDYDWLIGQVEEKEITNFQIEDIDGCEFVKVKGLGNALISHDHDFDGFMTGKIQVVYSDGSGSAISMEEAQERIDSGEWTVIKS